MEISAKTTEVNLALQVALQTMKERCGALQKRLTSVEEENQELRERIEDKRNNGTAFSPPTNGAAELFQLRLQLSEMQRQKTQMTEHLNMVSEENRKLWSRLSQIAKEHEHILGLVKDHNEPSIGDSCSVGGAQINEEILKSRGAAARAALAQQNLIRSKTFTQHSPNPNLRHKLLTDETAEDLNEIALEHNELETDEDNEDFEMEVQKCQEVMLELQREARSQHIQLKSAFEMLENKLASMPCPECRQRAEKPQMADKSLETDDSLSELRTYNQNNNSSNNNNNNNNNFNKKHDSHYNNVPSDLNQTVPTTRLNIIEEKIKADAMDKTCPMCGRTYNSNITFEAFQNHVEQHFIDDTYDVDNSIEHNFEFVSGAVGDF